MPGDQTAEVLGRRMEDKAIPVVLAEMALTLVHLKEGQADLKLSMHDMQGELSGMKEAVAAMPAMVDERLNGKLARFVSNERFEPIQKIVYSMIGLFLTGIVGALLAVIFRSKGIVP